MTPELLAATGLASEKAGPNWLEAFASSPELKKVFEGFGQQKQQMQPLLQPQLTMPGQHLPLSAFLNPAMLGLIK